MVHWSGPGSRRDSHRSISASVSRLAGKSTVCYRLGADFDRNVEGKDVQAMKMSKGWYGGLGVTGVVLLALIVCSSLRLLNGVIYRLGGIGVMVAILALAYAIIRKRA